MKVDNEEGLVWMVVAREIMEAKKFSLNDSLRNIKKEYVCRFTIQFEWTVPSFPQATNVM